MSTEAENKVPIESNLSKLDHATIEDMIKEAIERYKSKQTKNDNGIDKPNEPFVHDGYDYELDRKINPFSHWVYDFEKKENENKENENKDDDTDTDTDTDIDSDDDKNDFNYNKDDCDDDAETKLEVSKNLENKKNIFESNSGDVKVLFSHNRVRYVHKYILLSKLNNIKYDIKELDMTKYHPSVVHYFLRYLYYEQSPMYSKYDQERQFEILKLGYDFGLEKLQSYIAEDIVRISHKNAYKYLTLESAFEKVFGEKLENTEYVHAKKIYNDIIDGIKSHLIESIIMKSCYDSYTPGFGIRRKEHDIRLCCVHKDADLLRPAPEAFDDAVDGKPCSAFKQHSAMDNYVTKYCCLHKDTSKIDKFVEHFNQLPQVQKNRYLNKLL